jgi:hypothetical protein
MHNNLQNCNHIYHILSLLGGTLADTKAKPAYQESNAERRRKTMLEEAGRSAHVRTQGHPEIEIEDRCFYNPFILLISK